MSKEAKKLNPLTMTDQELIEHCNKQVQALRMALDMIECEKHDRRHVRWAIVDALKEWQPAQQEPVSVEHCVWARNGNSPCPHTSPQPAQQEQNNPLDCGMYLGTGKDRAIKHHVSYGIEPVDTLIATWQALEETSGHVLDEGGVEGRMHMSVIRSAWRQMDSLVREVWDERGCK